MSPINLFKQFFSSSLFRYLVTGAISFGIDFVAFQVLINTFQFDALPANMLSLLISMGFNFIMSNSWAFKAGNDRKKQKLARYLILVVINYFLNNTIFYILNSMLLLSPTLAKISVTILQAIWTFFFYKVWIFKGAKAQDDSQVIM